MRQLQLITNAIEVRECQEQLSKLLKKWLPCRDIGTIKDRSGECTERKIYYNNNISNSRRLANAALANREASGNCCNNISPIFWYPCDRGDRYWNEFGRSWKVGRATHTTVHISIPASGRKPKVSGLFAKDPLEGEVFLLHRGGVAGGQKGIGKRAFIKWYRDKGEWAEINDSEGTMEQDEEAKNETIQKEEERKKEALTEEDQGKEAALKEEEPRRVEFKEQADRLVEHKEQIIEVILITSLSDPSFLKNITTFIEKVDQFKKTKMNRTR